jgi:hypothetical protein
MLETLRKYDPSEAQQILSSLTAEVLPDPEVGARKKLGIDPHTHSDIWNEIRRRAKADPSDTSPAVRARLFEFLFAEMSQRALPQRTLESIKARLSARGELRPDLYEIEFDRFFRMSEHHGVRKNHVAEAIRNADDVEHLNIPDGKFSLSFFVRLHNEFGEKNAFALFVMAARVGAKLEVSDAFRIYASDVDISAAECPRDVLRLFVAKYGFTITIGDITSKLIINETTILRPPIDRDSLMKVHALDGTSIFGVALLRQERLHNSFRIALAFALDQEKYAADLGKHGVRVSGGDFRSPTIWTRYEEGPNWS